MSIVCGPTSCAPLTTTLGYELERRAEQHPGRVAVISDHENIVKTFAELNSDVNQLANVLRNLFKLKVGDVAAIWSFNCYDYVVVEYACARAGVVISLFDPNWRQAELENALKLTKPKALFLPSHESPQNFKGNFSNVFENSKFDGSSTSAIKTVFMEDLPNLMIGHDRTFPWFNSEPTSKSPCFVMFTSGSSGAPKAAQMSHFTVLNAVNSRTAYFEHLTNKRICLPLPLHHAFGSMSILPHLVITGATVVLSGYHYSTTSLLSALEGCKCNILAVVPTMVLDILQKVTTGSDQLTSLNVLVTSGAAAPLDAMYDLCDKVASLEYLSVGYGSTEAGSSCSFLFKKGMKKMGPAMPMSAHVMAKVVDSINGDIVPLGRDGLIMLKTPFFMDGYIGRTDFLEKDGFYDTGDIGCLDESGHLTVKGRAKEIISRGGEKFSPLEIEGVLGENKKVLKAAVFGLPDKRLGQEVCVWAQVVDALETSELDIVSFLSSRLAPYKVPKYVIVSTEDPPLTGSNKISKLNLVRVAMDKFRLH